MYSVYYMFFWLPYPLRSFVLAAIGVFVVIVLVRVEKLILDIIPFV